MIKTLIFFTHPKHFSILLVRQGDIIASASLPILKHSSSLSVLTQQKQKSYPVWGRKHILPLLGGSAHHSCFYFCAPAEMQSQLEISTLDLQLPWAHRSVAQQQVLVSRSACHTPKCLAGQAGYTEVMGKWGHPSATLRTLINENAALNSLIALLKDHCCFFS